jgi:hypothetical protein
MVQRKLMMEDDSFTDTMIEIEEDAWNAFKAVKHLGCNMSLKHHFLTSHLYFFPSNLEALSEEQGEMFHQELKDVLRRYHGRCEGNMMADYCWPIARDDLSREHSRTSRTHKFYEKGKRATKEF